MKKLMFYDPMNTIKEIHIKKDHLEVPRAFAKYGYMSYLISGKINIPKEFGIEYFETNNTNKNQLYIILEFKKVLKKLLYEDPDIIIFFHNNIMVPLFIIMYNILKPFKKNKATWIVMTDFDVNVEYGKSHLFFRIRQFGLFISSIFANFVTSQSSCHTSLLSNYINKDKIIPLPESYSSNFYQPYKYCDNKRENKILCVCRISPEKGIEILIKAFINIKNKHQDWKIEIAGPIVDNNYYNELINLINKNNLNGIICFLGFMDDIKLKEKYRKDAIYCLPSLNESFAISRFEAAINGMSVVTSNAGCGKDLANYGMHVFKNGDINDLSDILDKLMSDEKLRIKTSQNQMRLIKSFEDNVKNMINIINIKKL